MNFKKIFNVLLLVFITAVTLVPVKIKFKKSIPLSADFLLGGLLILAGFIALTFMLAKKEKVISYFNNKNIKLLTVFIIIFTLLSFFSITYANNKQAVITEGIRFLEYVLIFYLIIVMADSKTVDLGFNLFYISMILASIFGVVQFAFNMSEFKNGALFGIGRVYSTFVNPNYWGAAVNIVIFYPLIKLFDKDAKNGSRKYNIILFILFCFNLFFSSTRGSWLGFALGVFVIGLIKYRKYIYYSLGVVAVLFLIPFTRSRFLEAMNVRERLSLWKTGLYMFKDHFLLGVGNGNYIYEYKEYVKVKHPELFLGRSRFSVHNSYIKMLSELGIFGGISFVLVYLGLFNLIIDVYRFSKKYKNYALAFIGFGVSYLFQNLFNNLMFIPQLNVFVWILIALFYKGFLLEQSKIEQF